ncbi:MAG: sirohydrochlorin cobaltochelatase [bacterium]|nr:sirohydrochlorin cobaltochelatase [bacterium]
MSSRSQATHDDRPALVLAAFGTTAQAGLKGLFGVEEALRQAFPNTPLKVAFTSNQVRRVWQKRALDASFRAQHAEIPAWLYEVQGPLAAIANLQDSGHGNIVVQPAHIVPAEEFHDLRSYVSSLVAIRTMKPRWQPFRTLVLGRPALGAYGLKRPYSENIAAAAKALAGDLDLAREKQAALVYMGHGNRYFPSGGMYLEFAAAMRQLAPDLSIHIALVEGFPALSEVLAGLKKQALRRVLLKPFLISAGEHAMKDMAGKEPDSWRRVLEQEGFEVLPVLQGLGEIPAFARIFARHAAEAAHDAGLELS